MSPFRATTAGTDEHDGFCSRHLQLPKLCGNHVDTPLHLDPKGRGVDEISARDFLLAAAVANVRATVSACANDCLAATDLQKWEQKHGATPPTGTRCRAGAR